VGAALHESVFEPVGAEERSYGSAVLTQRASGVVSLVCYLHNRFRRRWDGVAYSADNRYSVSSRKFIPAIFRQVDRTHFK